MTTDRGSGATGAPIALRPAHWRDLAALSALAFASKAHWGYDAVFMAACRDELTLTETDLADASVAVAEIGGRLLGFAQLDATSEPAELLKLFIAPEAMGRGVGRRLFQWAVDKARRAGAEAIEIESDPNAAAFYRRMGAVDAGPAPSASIPGRVLPRLVLSTAPARAEH